MTAISVGAMPVSQSVSPAPIQAAKSSAAIKPGFRSSFSALLSDAAPDQTATKKSGTTNDAPASVAVAVPSPPKLLLPLSLTPQDDQVTTPEPSDTAPETLNLMQPLPASKNPVEELAFAAKLVQTAAQPQPASATTPAPLTPATIPQPKDQPLTLPLRTIAPTQTQPDAQGQQSPQTPVQNSHDLPAVTQIDSAPKVSTPVTPPAIEAPPPASTIDHVAQPLEHTPASPLNEITVRIENADQTSASIRMIDHSGELRVAVRASDPVVADTLRGSIDQLTSRLNSNGWSTEVWKPATVAAVVRTQSSSQEMFQGQHGSKDQQGERSSDGQNNNKQKYPNWVEEFYANNE